MSLRLASYQQRAQLVVGDNGTSAQIIDLATASNGEFSADPMDAYMHWNELREFASSPRVAELAVSATEVLVTNLDSPAPRPRQLFAIGLNYRRHAIEFGLEIPATPLAFTKFVSSIGPPCAEVPLTNDSTDWEVELVLIVGTGGREIAASSAWQHIAAICVGQDISNRTEQFATNPPQFSMGKSHCNYTVFGPWAVDVLDTGVENGLDLSCTVRGRQVQSSNSCDLIFSVPEIIEYLTSIVELYPGDVIYTGTPSGVGTSRNPQEFLTKGDVIVSTISSVGTITNVCI